jgi:hypothetical protein
MKIFKSSYRKEIGLALLLKILGLTLMWYFCFSDPLSVRINHNDSSERGVNNQKMFIGERG